MHQVVEELRRLGAEGLLAGRLDAAQSILHALRALEGAAPAPVRLTRPSDGLALAEIPTTAPPPPDGNRAGALAMAQHERVATVEAPTSEGPAGSPAATESRVESTTLEPEDPAFPAIGDATSVGVQPRSIKAVVEIDSAPPKKRRSPSTIARRIERFYKESGPLAAARGDDCPHLAVVLRTAVCFGRAVTDSEEADDSQLATINEELGSLGDALRRLPADDQFFGLNRNRKLPVEVWESLAECYQLLTSALECVEWIEREGWPGDSTSSRLISLCAAAETSLHRLIEERAHGVSEQIQERLHSRLQTLAETRGVFVEWWKSEAHGGRRTKEILAEARHLTSVYTDARHSRKRASQSEQMLLALQELLDAPANAEFDERLIERVAACLNAGIPPSDKRLRAMALPFREGLDEQEDPRMKRLVKYVQEDGNRHLAKHESLVDVDIPEDPDAVRRKEEVVQLLRGRRVLFVGGNPKPKRIREIEAALGLEELVWPASDKTSTSDVFLRKIDKVDLVCLVVLQARHARKQVIDRAKEQGKLTAWLPRGLGINRIVLDLHAQLIGEGDPEPALV